jgi:hypothetical protein
VSDEPNKTTNNSEQARLRLKTFMSELRVTRV